MSIVDVGCDSGEIGRVFGDETLTYVKSLAGGHVDNLQRLSTDVLYKIIAYLALEDIPRLSLVSKRLREVFSFLLNPFIQTIHNTNQCRP